VESYKSFADTSETSKQQTRLVDYASLTKDAGACKTPEAVLALESRIQALGYALLDDYYIALIIIAGGALDNALGFDDPALRSALDQVAMGDSPASIASKHVSKTSTSKTLVQTFSDAVKTAPTAAAAGPPPAAAAGSPSPAASNATSPAAPNKCSRLLDRLDFSKREGTSHATIDTYV